MRHKFLGVAVGLIMAGTVSGCERLGLGAPERGTVAWCEQFLDRQPATLTIEDYITYGEKCGDQQVVLAERLAVMGQAFSKDVAPEIQQRVQRIMEADRGAAPILPGQDLRGVPMPLTPMPPPATVPDKETIDPLQ